MRVSVANPSIMSDGELKVRPPSEQFSAPMETVLWAIPARFMAMLKSVEPRSLAWAGETKGSGAAVATNMATTLVEIDRENLRM